jgi:integrase
METECKYCGNLNPDGSVFCNRCGERIARREKKKKQEVKVPTPRQLPSGAWSVQLRAEKVNVTEPTREACITKAKAIRAGFIATNKALPKQSLESVIRKYITDNEAVMSPDTVRSDESMLRNRFKAYMKQDVNSIPWQEMISQESKDCASKTVINGWRLVTAALNYSKIPVPDVNLPQLVQDETPWLDYEQIQKFLKGIKGRNCELACLLALHSLRSSEVRALKQGSIQNGVIQVRGAVVPDKNNKFVEKDTNKNATSRRDVPVMIPRLTEIWPKEGEELKFQAPSPLRRMIERVCNEQGLPVITMHGLRHSFASLAYHLKWDIRTTCAVGGWSDSTCVQKIYTHLAARDKNEDIQKMIAFYATDSTPVNNDFTNEITNEPEKHRK